jgi:hypothetical protein
MKKLNVINITCCANCIFIAQYEDDLVCCYYRKDKEDIHFYEGEGADVIHERCPIKDMGEIVIRVGESCNDENIDIRNLEMAHMLTSTGK